MKLAAIIPVPCYATETGELLESINLTRSLYVGIRREAREAGVDWNKLLSLQVKEALEFITSSQDRRELFQAALREEIKGAGQ